MKHLFTLCLAALMGCIGAWAQNNVTDGRTVVPLAGLKTYTSEDGQTSYTISEEDLQKITVEGNTANVYLFPENGALNTEANRTLGIQGFYIDLGEAKTISAVNTTWEGAAAGGSVYVTDVKPADDGTLSAATEIATFSNAQETTKTANVSVENSGRYIVFVPTEATNYAWGVKIRTFVAYDNESAELTSLTIAPTFTAPNTATTFTATLLDKAGSAMTGASYKVDGVEVASLEGISLTAGSHTISATIGDVTLQQTVYALSAPAIPAEADICQAIYTNGVEDGTVNGAWSTVYNGGAVEGAELTIDGQRMTPFSAAKCVFFTERVLWEDIFNVNINPSGSGYGKLRMDIFCGVNATGRVNLEQTKAIAGDVPFTLTAGEWKTVEVDLDGETFIKAMSVRMDGGEDIVLANIYFTKAVVDETANLVASVELGNRLIAKNTATDLGVVVRNAKGVAIDAALYTLSADKGSFDSETGLFTTTVDGPITITATSTVDTSIKATATLRTYPEAATTPEDAAADVLAVYSGTYDARTYDPSDKGWNGGYGSQEEIELSASEKAILVQDGVCFGVNAGGADVSGYDFLNVAIYSCIDFEGHIQIEGTAMSTLPISLTANQWNYIKAELSGTRTGATWIQMYVGSDETKNTVVIDNIYFSKAPAGAVIIGESLNAQGVRTVTGTITNANKSEVAALTDAAIDLSGASIEGDVESVSVGNPNAIIIVAGEVGEANAATTTQTAVKGNRVVKNGAWYFPVEQIVIEDNTQYPLWTGYFVSGNAAGWAYCRELAADAYATVVVPATTAVPEGVTAYTLEGYADGSVTFVEAGNTFEAGKPYIVKTTDAATIEISSTADLDLRTPGSTNADGATFQANYVQQQMSDVYVLDASEDDLTFKKASNANVGAFRAYLTGVSAAASVKVLIDGGDATGIMENGQFTIDNGQLRLGNGQLMYDLNGRRISSPAKGIYVVNGKKVAVVK